MGTTAQGVLRASRCPLLAVERSARPPAGGGRAGDAPYRRILVPVDGSQPAQAGLREAIRLASGRKAAVLRLLHVIEPHPVLHGMDLPIADTWLRGKVQAGEKILREAQACAGRRKVRSGTVLHRRPDRAATDVITEEAQRWKADIVVMGTHGRRGISRAVLGSNAEAVVRASVAPVMTVRG
jgi:nucleotide-binding universal stress UspA family protein